MLQSYYTSGTISVVAGSTALALVGAALNAGTKPGDILIIGGVVGVIESIESNTAATLTQPWAGATVAGTSDYLILRTGAEWSSNIPISVKLAKIIASIQAGLQVSGALVVNYVFSSVTNDQDPGPGCLALGSAPQQDATVLRASNADTNGVSALGILGELVASNSFVKSRVRLFKTADPTKWITFDVASLVDKTGYRNITVASVGASSESPFTAGDEISLVGTPNGDAGTLADDSVTNAKLKSVPQYRVKARYSPEIGSYEDVPIGPGLKLDATSLRLDLSIALTFANDLWVSAAGSDLTNWRGIGVSDQTAGTAVRLLLDGFRNSLQLAKGGRLALQAENGIVIAGGRGPTGTIDFGPAGAGTSDPALTIAGNETADILQLRRSNGGDVVASVDKDGILKFGGLKRLTGNVSRTSNVTLGLISDLAVPVKAGKRYRFKAVLWVDAGTTGGHKYEMGGTCSANSMLAQIISSANGGTTTIIHSRRTSLNGAGAGQAGSTNYYTTIEGFIDVSATGMLGPQFAQNASNATASTVLAGSFFDVQEMD